MYRKKIIMAILVVITIGVVAGIVFAPSSDTESTNIDILNQGEIGTNSTLYIKLTDINKTALSGKTVNIQLTNNESEVVYNESVETHATGVALAQLNNISPGEYNLSVSFDGDANYTASSISKKVNITGDEVEDEVDNSSLVEDTSAQSQSASGSSYQSSYSQSSYYYRDSSSSSNSYYPSYDNYADDSGGNDYQQEYAESVNQI